MTSLNITQSTSASETVNVTIIEKLYNLALVSNVQDQSSQFSMSLQGNITSPTAFKDSVLYLREKFPNLTINVQDNAYYIRFADSTVEQVLKDAGHGDGVGITEYDAASIVFNQALKGNTSIRTFNEFSYFTAQQNSAFSFQGCTSLTSIDLHNLKRIATNSCFQDTALVEVNDLGTITSIPNNCFAGCTNLVHVTLPDSCTSLGVQCFRTCNNLSFDLSDFSHLTEIKGNRDGGAFFLTAQTTVTINYPDENNVLYLPNMAKLGSRIFAGQPIKEINLPNLNELHCLGVFAYCSQLTKVTSLGSCTLAHNDTQYVGLGLFQDCTQLTEVNIPSSCTEVTPAMFKGCSSLSTINWDLSVITGIFRQAFMGCTQAPKVMYFPNVTQAGYPMTQNEKNILGTYTGSTALHASQGSEIFANSSIKNVYLPKLKVLCLETPGTSGGRPNPSGNFVRTSINLIYLRDVQSIGAMCFYGATINTLIINNTTVPSVAVYNDAGIFNGGQLVLDIYNRDLPTHTTDLFIGISSILNIYVPDSAVSDYQNNSFFSSVASVIKPLSTCPRKTLNEVNNGEIGLIEAYM